MNNRIDVNHLQVAFQTKEGLVKAVNHLSMSFEKGSVTAMIGETGSGKSVLGLSLLQLLPENSLVSGEAFYENQNLLMMKASEIRKIRGQKIALIPQNPDTSLNPLLKIKRQLREVVAGKHRQNLKAGILEELKRYHFTDPERVADAYPFQLSGGMKQRILAAAATIRQPEFIIADEPTKGLDVLLRHEVYHIFQQMKQDTHIGFLLITHDLIFANHIADHLLVLYAGEIVESGQTQDLFSQPFHPYTKGFIEAQPYKTLTPIPGMPPSLIHLPTGCAFHPRCPHKKPLCQQEKPPLFSVNHRKVRCFLYA